MTRFLTLLIATGFILLTNCSQETTSAIKDTYTNSKKFNFNTDNQLEELPSFGNDPSYIENNQLKSVISINKHKGLGKKFNFNIHSNEPDESMLSFDIWLPASFQKNGNTNEVSKFSGFEGIYDNTAGWGGKKVTTQKSWSIRIAHSAENDKGNIPIGLYIYHPGMQGNYGTIINPNFELTKEQTHRLKLYVKLNTIGKSNGVISLFVDNKQIYSSDKWLLRNHNDVHIKAVWLDTYIGGKTPSASNTYILMDNLWINW